MANDRGFTQHRAWMTLALLALCTGCGDEALQQLDGGATSTGNVDANVSVPVARDGALDAPPDSARDASLPDAKTAIPDAGTPDAASQSQILAVCSDMARARCGKFEACSPRLFAQRFASGALCQAAVAWECNSNLRFAGINWTFDQATVCAAKTAAMTCSMWLSDGHDPSCNVGPGLLRDGEGCRVRVTNQCGPQSYCSEGDANGCGICRPRIALTQTCASNDSCVKEGRCLFDVSGKGTCEPYAALGETCDPRKRCPDAFICPAGRASCVASVSCKGTCQLTLAGEGEDCLRAPCDKRRALLCNPTTFKCELDPACSGSGPMAGCPGAVPVGKPCSPNTPCAAPATCVQGICAFPNVDAQCTL